ncbi:na+ h+ antiporter [Fusarium sporotrichioides]|uniref:Na+ h+ antiporter n=1 Tax=Fusarium sporotrichioides TaxID=5514 RepID=A0A395S0B5_FUSSP|nr:na+ h+ antiporter [Fusarium sporotrichioides]
MSMLNATPLQAFAAGAALCSTSLGTTFTILGTSGLSSTRLGVVLTSAAMMDDVVGLVMVQVISNLGSDSFDAVTIVRPIVVSLGFAIVIPILCRLVVVPVTLRLNSYRMANPSSMVSKLFGMDKTAFFIHTGYLLGIVIGATFAGTSSLLAAYIAGASISWWDSEVPHLELDAASPTVIEPEETSITDHQTREGPCVQTPSPKIMEGGSGAEIFQRYYEPSLQRLLKPLFFASIGFSVPITQLFTGPTVWRGVIYTVLMIFAKLACGLWLLSFTIPFRALTRPVRKIMPTLKKSSKTLAPGAQCADSSAREGSSDSTQQAQERDSVPLQPLADTDTSQSSPNTRNSTPKPEKALSLYPACIVGIGMVARGEIGYLISALAESKGVFGRSENGQSSEIFLIVTWAITLCTVIGPICVGLIVNRVRKLENRSKKAKGGSRRNVLGAWGVS